MIDKYFNNRDTVSQVEITTVKESLLTSLSDLETQLLEFTENPFDKVFKMTLEDDDMNEVVCEITTYDGEKFEISVEGKSKDVYKDKILETLSDMVENEFKIYR